MVGIRQGGEGRKVDSEEKNCLAQAGKEFQTLSSSVKGEKGVTLRRSIAGDKPGVKTGEISDRHVNCLKLRICSEKLTQISSCYYHFRLATE